MSDTPETDAEEYCLEPYPHYVKSSFARRLERERNEALESLSSVRKQLVAANRGAETNAKVNQGLCARLAEAERERDEARNIAKMAYTRSIGLGVSSHTQIQFMHDAINKWDKEQKEEAK